MYETRRVMPIFVFHFRDNNRSFLRELDEISAINSVQSTAKYIF